MDFQSSFSPYGLKSLVECISRAALLSQPEDIPNFLKNYTSELVAFRDSNNETDPKVACFLFEEQLENTLMRNTEGRAETAESKGTTEPESVKTQPTPPKAPKPERAKTRPTRFKVQGPESSRKPTPTRHHAPTIAEKSLPGHKQSLTPKVVEPESTRTQPTPPKAPKPERAKTRPTRFKVQGPESSGRPTPISHRAPTIAEKSLPGHKQSLTPKVVEPESTRTQPTPPKAPKPERAKTRKSVLPPIPQKEKSTRAQLTTFKVQEPESNRRPASTSCRLPVITQKSLLLRELKKMEPDGSRARHVTFGVHAPKKTTELSKPVSDRTRRQYTAPRVLEPESPKPDRAKTRPTRSRSRPKKYTISGSQCPCLRTEKLYRKTPKPESFRICEDEVNRPFPDLPEPQYSPQEKTQYSIPPLAPSIPEITEKRSMLHMALDEALKTWPSPLYPEKSDAPEISSPQTPINPWPVFPIEKPEVLRPYRHTCPHLAKKLGNIFFSDTLEEEWSFRT